MDLSLWVTVISLINRLAQYLAALLQLKTHSLIEVKGGGVEGGGVEGGGVEGWRVEGGHSGQIGTERHPGT